MNDLRKAIRNVTVTVVTPKIKYGIQTNEINEIPLTSEATDAILQAFESALPEEYDIALESESYFLDGYNAALYRIKDLIHQAKTTKGEE